MTPTKPRRVQQCDLMDAKKRQAHALKFLEAAELVAIEEPDCPESASVASSLAVLAGIAAADAACCAALRQRSRAQDHHEAEQLLGEITPGGSAMQNHLRRLLNLKDTAQYGFINVSGQDLKAVLRQASALTKFSDEVLQRKK